MDNEVLKIRDEDTLASPVHNHDRFPLFFLQTTRQLGCIAVEAWFKNDFVWEAVGRLEHIDRTEDQACW